MINRKSGTEPRADGRRETAIKCAVVFIAGITVFVSYVLIRLGYENLFRSFGDGHLYVSVADNILDSGHFIQTIRTERDNMVVPFGLPFMLLPFRLITRSDLPLTLLPFAVFGATNVLAFLSERRLFGTSGMLSAAFLTIAYAFRYECSPVFFCCTEVWYTFFLYAALYAASRIDLSLARRLGWVNGLTFWAMCIRPVLAPIYIAAAAYTLWCAAKRSVSVKRAAVYLLIPAVIMAAFTGINYRETGQPVLFENYAAPDLWSANNPDSDALSIEVFDLYEEMKETTGIDYARDSALYKAKLRDYIKAYPGKFISDTARRFFVMFVWEWRLALLPVIAAAALLIARDKKRRCFFGTLLGLMLLLMAATSTGMNIKRYTFFVVPFWNVFLAGAFSLIRPYLNKLRELPGFIKKTG